MTLRYQVGTEVAVTFTDLDRAPDPASDLKYQGQIATVVERVTKAQRDGYGIRFGDGYKTYAYEHELEAVV